MRELFGRTYVKLKNNSRWNSAGVAARKRDELPGRFDSDIVC
jgi:hypothetical protein